MISKAKLKANHRNGAHGKGPKTSRGKLISSRNAQKHGLLSKELIMSADEEPIFEQLKRSLGDELNRDSVLLSMLADDVGVCFWELMLCLRRKHEYLAQRQSQSNAIETGSPALSAAELRGDWNVRRRLDLLQELRNAVRSTGQVTPAWEDLLVGAFGQPFYDLLIEWHTTEGQFVLLGETIVKKDKVFNHPPPSPEAEVSAAARRQARLEAPLRRDAIMKLLELKEEFLVAQHSTETSLRDSAGSDPLEVHQRYETTARRNLHRAVREYLQVAKDLHVLRKLSGA